MARRKSDHVNPWSARSYATSFVIGGSVFLYQMREMFMQHTESTGWYGTPANWAEVTTAALSGMIAMGAALGLKVEDLIAGFHRS